MTFGLLLGYGTGETSSNNYLKQVAIQFCGPNC